MTPFALFLSVGITNLGGPRPRPPAIMRFGLIPSVSVNQFSPSCLPIRPHLPPLLANRFSTLRNAGYNVDGIQCWRYSFPYLRAIGITTYNHWSPITNLLFPMNHLQGLRTIGFTAILRGTYKSGRRNRRSLEKQERWDSI
jgi:hypothetical protein